MLAAAGAARAPAAPAPARGAQAAAAASSAVSNSLSLACYRALASDLLLLRDLTAPATETLSADLDPATSFSC